MEIYGYVRVSSTDQNKDRQMLVLEKQNIAEKNIYRPLLERLNIPYKTIHCTRHTTATLLAEGGADMNAIKQILGHSSYAFTADTYTHVDVEFLKNEINKL